VFGRAMAGQLRELRVGRRARAASAASRCEALPGTAVLHVTPPRRFDAHAVRTEGSIWPQLLAGRNDVLMDLCGVEFLDSTAVGVVVRLQKTLRAQGKHLVLVAPSPVVLRAMELMRLSDFFSIAKDAAAGLALLKERSGETSVVLGVSLEAQPGPVAWQGEITAANKDEVERATERQLAGAVGRFSVQLGGVRFIDSSGIGLLVKLRKQAHRAGVELEFLEPSETVRKVARLLRMEDYLFGRPS
jgi:anti-anti-sigma factor